MSFDDNPRMSSSDEDIPNKGKNLYKAGSNNLYADNRNVSFQLLVHPL